MHQKVQLYGIYVCLLGHLMFRGIIVAMYVAVYYGMLLITSSLKHSTVRMFLLLKRITKCAQSAQDLSIKFHPNPLIIFFSNVIHKQTDRQTYTTKNITSFIYLFVLIKQQ